MTPCPDKQLPPCACGIVNELSKDWMTKNQRSYWEDVVQRVHARGTPQHWHHVLENAPGAPKFASEFQCTDPRIKIEVI